MEGCQVTTNLPNYLTLSEAAATMRCSTRHIRQQVRDGHLAALMYGGRMLIDASELPRAERMRTEVKEDGPRKVRQMTGQLHSAVSEIRSVS